MSDQTTDKTVDETIDNGEDLGDWQDQFTPPHPSEGIIEAVIRERLAAFAATIEPNWLKVDVLVMSDFTITVEGPRHGKTGVTERQVEIAVGEELYKLWMEVVYHSVCSYGMTVLNPNHVLRFVEGRTQFKLRDPRPYSIEDRQHMYDDCLTRGEAFTSLVWNEPYSAVMVNTKRGYGWFDLLVIDERDRPTGELFPCHIRNFRYTLKRIIRSTLHTLKPGEWHERYPYQSCRIDTDWPLRYRSVPVLP